MLKLIELLKINDLKYTDEIKPKHQTKIDMQTEIVKGEVIVPDKPFPENSSKKTLSELEWLRDLNYGARFTGKSWVPFSRENVLKTMKILANNINECEKVRCGLTSYGAPDFIQYAHARKSM